MLAVLSNPTAQSETLPISRIRVDGGTQMRAGLNEQAVKEYVDAIIAGDMLPDPVAFYDGSEYWLGDGFHRVDAYRRVHGAMHRLNIGVRAGTRRDAVLFAAAANAKHGLRRTPEDKQRAVDTLLRDEEWGQWSDREIARHCNVSPTFVGNRRRVIRPSAEGGDTHRTYETKHGTVAAMNTAKIGKLESVKKELDGNGCIALVWRAIKHNFPMNQPVDRLRWLQTCSMQAIWSQLAYDEARPSDGQMLHAIGTVSFELNGQIEHERKVKERAAQFTPNYTDPANQAQQNDIVTADDEIERVITETLEDAVRRALCVFTGDADRWRDMAALGASNHEITGVLEHTIKSSGGSYGPGLYHVEHMKGPQIKISRHIQDSVPLVIARGKELVEWARKVWAIPLPVELPVTVHVDSEENEIPIVVCPNCGQSHQDFDGLGVLHCEACGYCTHPSATGGICGLCGASVGDDDLLALRTCLLAARPHIEKAQGITERLGHKLWMEQALHLIDMELKRVGEQTDGEAA